MLRLDENCAVRQKKHEVGNWQKYWGFSETYKINNASNKKSTILAQTNKHEIFLLSFILLLTSCASVKYSSEYDKKDFSKVKNGETYVVWGENNFRKRLTVTAVDNDSIKGTSKTEVFAIHKNAITKIRKNNTGGTVALSYIGAGGILFLTAVYLYSNSPRTVEK